MEKKKELLLRAYFVFLAFFLLSLVIIYRVIRVNIFESEKWIAKGEKNIKLQTLHGERGNIFSEEFNLLSTSIKFFEIRMDLTVPSNDLFRNGIDSLAIYLSRDLSLDRTPSEWKNRLVKGRRDGKRYFLIKKKVNVDQLKRLKKYPILREGRFGGGLIVNAEHRRIKPYKEFASRTIGLVRDNARNVGLEAYFDEVLKGDSTQVLMKKVTYGKTAWIPLVDVEKFQPQSGKDIRTTINIDMQDIVHNELLKRVKELDAKAGCAVLMEVKTGAIKAISNFSRREDGSYGEDYNYAVGNKSEPGSTFKLATALALIDDGHCDMESQVDLKGGKMRFYDKVMYDSEIHGKRRVTLREAFIHSSNVGMAKLGHDYYNIDWESRTAFINKLKSFGLKDKTGIEIPGEAIPYIKNLSKEKNEGSLVSIPWMSTGYELQLTPLQVLNFYNTVANDGRMMRPHLVNEIRKGETVLKRFVPKTIRKKIASAESINMVRSLLEGVVQSGTGRKLQSDIVEIAGKTGTTRVNYSRKEEEKKYNASFVGYFPAHDPKYSLIVVIYEPGGHIYYGASAAGPAFKNIAERVVTLKENIEFASINENDHPEELPDRVSGYKKDFEKVFRYVGLDYKSKNRGNWVKVNPLEKRMVIQKNKISKSKVPDLKGMGARDAVYVLENLGLNVVIDGKGKVVKQSIKPGSKIKGQDITIVLN